MRAVTLPKEPFGPAPVIDAKDIPDVRDIPKVDTTGDLRPEYYQQGGLQPWDVIDAFQLDFYGGNVLRYLLRCGKKSEEEGGGTIKDLIKCRTYVNKMLRNAGYQDVALVVQSTVREKRPLQGDLKAAYEKLRAGLSLTKYQREELMALVRNYYDV